MGSVPVAWASANSLEVTEERFQIRGKLRNGMSTRSTPGASLHPGTTLGTLSLSPITVHPRTRPALQSLLCSAPPQKSQPEGASTPLPSPGSGLPWEPYHLFLSCSPMA